MNSDKRGLLRVKAHLPDMRSLKFFSSKLTSLARNRVVQKYGKIIDLLNVPLQVEAITALAQFYDQPLRCFTFQDFQLAPTLEEFEQILDSPKKEKGPYRGIGQVVKIEELAPALNIPPSELVLHYKKHSSPAPVPVSIEEVDKLRTIIDRLESEKEALQHDIYQVNYERNELTFKLNERTKELKMAKKAIEDEERKRQKVAACLAGSTEEIKGRNQLLDQAWKEVDSVRGAWEQTLKGKNQLKEGYEVRILSITASLQESQVVALNERRLRGIAEKKLQGLPNNWRELMKEMQDLKESEWRQKKEYEAISAQNQQLEAEVRHLREIGSQDLAATQKILEEATKWKADFSNLAGFANNVVRDIPRIHKKAYAAMFPDNTPPAVFNFVESCGVMLREFRASLDAARKARL
ncbi:hypothetical protein P8452_14301 [Trifolium repens]|nr:hypothetical protein P8452_14301 [Trifolium repens]